MDTCVWRDFYEDRTGKTGNPLAKHAAEFFGKILRKKWKIIYSNASVSELRKEYTKNEIHNLLNIFLINNTLSNIETTGDEFGEAKQLAHDRNLPKVDCLFAIQARNHQAIMVSVDRDFEELKDIVIAARPEDIN